MNPVEFFLNDLQGIEARMYKDIDKLLSGSISRTELISLVNEIDFFEELNNNGYMQSVQSYLDKYDMKVSDIIKLGTETGLKVSTFNIAQLELLRDIDGESIMRSGQMFSSEMKGQLLKGLLTGTNLTEIRNNLLPQMQNKVTFKANWFDVMVNTGYRQYNASAYKTMFDDEPNARFKLHHPLDNHTRKQCIHAIQVNTRHPEGFTMDEIDSGILGKYKMSKDKGFVKYDMLNLGGFNCRGEFIEIQEDEE